MSNQDKEQKMELKPAIGIDMLKFGMTKKEVIAILGEPDLIWDVMDDASEKNLRWNDKKLDLTFFQNKNDQFWGLRTSNTQLRYQDNKIIGMKIEFVKKQVFGSLIPEWKAAPMDDHEILIAHFNEKNGIDLQVEYGVVTDLEMKMT